MEAVGALSPGGPHTHTAEDLQAVVASRHVYPALKDCDPRSTAVRAHWGHHCPPSGKSQSRSGAMRAGVPVPPRQLRKVRAHCTVFPRARITSPPLSASPTSCSWLSLAATCPLPQTHGCSLLSSASMSPKASYRSAPPLHSLSCKQDHPLPSAILVNSALLWPLALILNVHVDTKSPRVCNLVTACPQPLAPGSHLDPCNSPHKWPGLQTLPFGPSSGPSLFL